MRALIQRANQAQVTCQGTLQGQIGNGLCILLGVEDADSKEDADWLAPKLLNLRIFADEEGKMNRSVQDIGGGLLVVSQFTLHASTKKGNRPSFVRAAKPAHAEELYDYLLRLLGESGLEIAAGVFGGDMQVQLTNDGPVTIWIDTQNRE